MDQVLAVLTAGALVLGSTACDGSTAHFGTSDQEGGISAQVDPDGSVTVTAESSSACFTAFSVEIAAHQDAPATLFSQVPIKQEKQNGAYKVGTQLTFVPKPHFSFGGVRLTGEAEIQKGVYPTMVTFVVDVKMRDGKFTDAIISKVNSSTAVAPKGPVGKNYVEPRCLDGISQ